MNKLILFVLLLVSFSSSAVEYTLEDGEEITINPGSLYYALYKGGFDTLINFFHGFCGSNQCQVDENEPFDLSYKVNNVSSCHGTGGTPEWQGSLPVGSGSGEFTKSISGVDENTTFTLNCSRTFAQSELVVFNQIDLSQIIRNIGYQNNFSVLTALVGTEIKVLSFDQFSKAQNFTFSKSYGKDAYAIFYVGDRPAKTYNDFVNMVDEADTACYSVGGAVKDVPMLKLASVKTESDVCQKDLSVPFYLSYGIYKK